MSAQNPTPDDLRTIATNLNAEGQTSRAEVLNNAAAELAAKDKVIEAARKAAASHGIPHKRDGYAGYYKVFIECVDVLEQAIAELDGQS